MKPSKSHFLECGLIYVKPGPPYIFGQSAVHSPSSEMYLIIQKSGRSSA